MPSTAPTTIDDAEVARFSAIADEWWDENGKFAPLHRLGPVRIAYVRDQIIRHFLGSEGVHGASATPLNNLSLVDIGCGGGLMSEPMARLGARVTGVDASETNIRIAQAHAESSGVSLAYRATTAEQLALEGAQFNVVMALEIIEHVADVGLFYDAICHLLAPGGLLILSTLNRTAKSYAMGIVGAEMLLRWLPRGTHDWSKFIKPSEMAASLRQRGFTVVDTSGIRFSPLRWSFALDPKDLDVNYLMTAQRSTSPSTHPNA